MKRFDQAMVLVQKLSKACFDFGRVSNMDAPPPGEPEKSEEEALLAEETLKEFLMSNLKRD